MRVKLGLADSPASIRRLAGLACAFLGLGFWLVPAVAQEGAGQILLEISFVFQIKTELPVKGVLVLRPQEGEGEPVRKEIASAAPISLRLPTGSKWEK